MKKLLLALMLLPTCVLAQNAAQIETETSAVKGIELSARSTCEYVDEQKLLKILAERLGGTRYPIIPPNQRGLRIHADLHCDPYEEKGGHVLYTGAVALQVLARVDRPFSDTYWLPIFDYKIFGAKTAQDLDDSFTKGVDEFISAAKTNVTPKAYQGFGMQPPGP